MESERPDPDELLAEVKAAAARAQRGRLKIFFGASAGVGKTFSMLAAAQALRRAGTDVVVGLLETHGRAETAALLEGLELLPPLMLDVRGTSVKEFDLDAALRRHPALLLVDELAHTNAPGARHPKRWQDVDELLAPGIDVYTTLNVQHIESLNDVIGQITGIQVSETLPDTFFETADEVELIDLSPDELLKRLREGKVYVPHQAERALANFFKKGNLIALREMALRQTADRVDAQMREYRDEEAIAPVWAAGERIVVAIGPDKRGEQLVRAAKRLADSIDAEWHAVYVETPSLLRLAQSERNRILGYLRLAEQLGAKTSVLSATNVAEELLGFARDQNATRLRDGQADANRVAALAARFGHRRGDGAPARPGPAAGRRPRSGAPRRAAGFADQLARTKAYLGIDESKPASRKVRWPGYAAAAGHLRRGHGAGLAAVRALRGDQPGHGVPGRRAGRRLSLRPRSGDRRLGAVGGVVRFALRVRRYYSFAVSDTQYLLTFAVMLLVGLTISNLTASIRLQARVAQHRQARTEDLYTMTRELSRAGGLDEVVTIAVQQVARVFEAQAVVLIPNAAGTIGYPQRARHLRFLPRSGPGHRALGVRQSRGGRAGQQHPARCRGAVSAAGRGAQAGRGAGGAAFAARAAAHSASSGICWRPSRRRSRRRRSACCSPPTRRSSPRQAETESLRNSLLNAISHDLRTPLAVLVGASSSLVTDDRLSDAARKELAATVHDEATRMTALVNNLLDMARLESGAIALLASGRRWKRSSAACWRGCARSWRRIRSRSRLPPRSAAAARRRRC